MLVRCVRQDLRSKVFIGVFCILLAISVIACLVAASHAANGISAERTYGRDLFVALAGAWSFALIVVQASATHRLVAQERNDDTWDLVELTGLPPRRIVRGLLFASLTQSLLYTAAIAPFVVMAYLLRGLDLPTILTVLIVVPLLGVVAAAIGLFFACCAGGRRGRAAGGGVIGVIMLLGWIFACNLLFSPLAKFITGPLAGATGLGSVSSTWAVPLFSGLLIDCWLMAVWLLLVLSTALLTHRADDRSSRPRFAVLVLLGNVLAVVAGLWGLGLLNAGALPSLSVSIAFPVCLLITVTAFFALTEDYALTPRQARSIAGSHGWRRRLSGLLGPGATRGRWFVIALTGIAALFLIPGTLAGAEVAKAAALAWYAFGYGLLLLIVGDRLARGVFARWCQQPATRRLVVIAVASAWLILPPLAALMVPPEGVPLTVLRLLSPHWAAYFYAFERPQSPLAAVLFLLPALCVGILAVQALRHRTLVTRRVLAEDGDRNPRA